MFKFTDIMQFIRKKSKTLLLLCFVFMLTSCGEGDCPTIQETSTQCPLCKFFRVLVDAAKELADASWNHLASGLADLVLVISAIYIALYTMRMVTSFGKQTLADYFTGDKMGLLTFLFKVAIIFLLLKSVEIWGENEFVALVLSPLLQASFEIGSKLTLVGEAIIGTKYSPDWDGIFEMTYDAAHNFNDSIHFVVGIGEAMTCDSVEGIIIEWKVLQFIYGSLLFIFGWFLLIGVSFYLVDLIVRLTFGAILLPVGIACAISKLSMVYAKNIWNLFVNVFFGVILLGILIALILHMVELCIGYGAKSPAINEYVFDIQRAIDENRISELSGAFANFGHLLLTLVCFSIMVQLLEQMKILAGEISETSIADAISPSKAVAPIAKAGMENAKRAGQWAGGTAVEGAKHIGHDVARATRMDKLYRWGAGKAAATHGFFTGRGSKGYNSLWRRSTWRRFAQEMRDFKTDTRSGRFRRIWNWIK